jgi:DNA polymerase-3 subunit epsilon
MGLFDKLWRRPSRIRDVSGTVSAAPFGHLASFTDRVVVVDTETTGVYNADRVVEVAVVTLDLDGLVIDEWDTLVHPGRDVGPTWIHGITASMLVGAPTFDEVGAEIAKRVHGAVLCGHNLPFDTRMLRNEFLHLGIELDPAQGLDTYRVQRSALEAACAAYGIALDGAHRALVDARATARLAVRLADQFAEAAPARFLSPVPGRQDPQRLCRAADAPQVVAPPSFLAKLTTAVVHHPDSYAMALYLDLLDRAMGDVHLTDGERAELDLLAAEVGLNADDRQFAHRRWVDDLIAAARADGVVDGDEYEKLLRAAHWLGVNESRVRDRTVAERATTGELLLEAGLGVCFTGEAVGPDGEMIDRDALEIFARNMGLRPEGSFTKSRCSVLIAADPATVSTKANQARKWGLPIVAATDFLEAYQQRHHGPQRVPCTVSYGATSTAVRCPSCGLVTIQSDNRKTNRQCPTCEPPGPPLTARPRAKSPAPSRAPGTTPTAATTRPEADVEVLVCHDCGSDFSRIRTRGRKPLRCPACAT